MLFLRAARYNCLLKSCMSNPAYKPKAKDELTLLLKNKYALTLVQKAAKVTKKEEEVK